MMYVEVNDKGEVLREFNTARLIEKVESVGEYPRFIPLEYDPDIRFDAMTHKVTGFDYLVHPKLVLKTPHVDPLTGDERALRRIAKALEAREAGIGEFLVAVEPIARALVAVIEGTEVSDSDLSSLKQIVSFCEGHPVR